MRKKSEKRTVLKVFCVRGRLQNALTQHTLKVRVSEKFYLCGRLQHIPSYRWLSYIVCSKSD